MRLLILMTAFLLLLIAVPVSAQQEQITWGCKVKPGTEDYVTLNCQERADKTKTFDLFIPKDQWLIEWSQPGLREFYYGGGKEGSRYPIKTKPTFCDAEYLGGDRQSFQLCGKMFPD